MYAFYITGIVDFQTILTPLLTSLKKGKKCWVCFFDSLFLKRQFYFYKPQELISFIEELCVENDVEIPIINFYGQKDEQIFLEHYDQKQPDVVFLKNGYHKHPIWYPTAHASKVIHFAHGSDSVTNLHLSPYKINLNVLQKEYIIPIEKQLEMYNHKHPNVDHQYFGDFCIEQFNFKKLLKTIKAINTDKKICFIPESWLPSTTESEWNKIGEFADKVVGWLQNNGYYVVYKTREKGYPKYNDELGIKHNMKWASILDFMKNKPDFIIKKDLNFPSSLVYYPLIADICVSICNTGGMTSAKSINKNVIEFNSNIDFELQLSNKIEYFRSKKQKKNIKVDAISELLLDYIDKNVG